MGKVVLWRKNNYLGALVKHNIYIDGYMIGKIGNGQVVNIDVDEAQYLASLIPADRGQLRTLHEVYYGNTEKDFKPVSAFVNEMNNNYPELWKGSIVMDNTMPPKLKLNYKRTFLIGYAFFDILLLLQLAYSLFQWMFHLQHQL